MEIGKLRVNVPTEDNWIDVFLLGDFHEGNVNHDEEALVGAVKLIKDNIERNPYTFVILMGDYCEYITSQSDPRWDPVATSDKYKLKDLKNLALKQNEYVFEKVEPIKDYVVGLLIGNHGEAYIKHSGTDVYNDFAKRFQFAKKLGYLGYFGFNVEIGGVARGQIVFALNHGEGGGGKTLGYIENRLHDLFEFEERIDFGIAGHLHKLVARAVTKRSPNRYLTDLIRRRVWLGCSGCFLRTSKVGSRNYFEHKGREESDIGMLKASFRFKRHNRDKKTKWYRQTLLKKIVFNSNMEWEEIDD